MIHLLYDSFSHEFISRPANFAFILQNIRIYVERLWALIERSAAEETSQHYTARRYPCTTTRWYSCPSSQIQAKPHMGDESKTAKVSGDQLNDTNWLRWIDRVQDYLYGKNAREIFEQSLIEPTDDDEAKATQRTSRPIKSPKWHIPENV